METNVITGEEKMISSTALQADYELLADLFIYPLHNSYKERIREIQKHLFSVLPESADAMSPYLDFMNHSSLTEMQELFLRSFDVQAITTLDIGFVLFGEDYKRGQLLVHLNGEHREAGNVCETELSDHLTNVLRLLPKMKDLPMRNEIALRLVIPAVEKMIAEFDFKKIEKKDEVYKKHLKTVIEYSQAYRTVYQSLLQSLFMALKNDFGYEPPAASASASMTNEIEAFSSACGTCSHNTTPSDFGGSIENELTIEK